MPKSSVPPMLQKPTPSRMLIQNRPTSGARGLGKNSKTWEIKWSDLPASPERIAVADQAFHRLPQPKNTIRSVLTAIAQSNANDMFLR